MNVDQILTLLEYSSSRSFLRADQVEQSTNHAHIFRRAVQSCNLRGIYHLKEGSWERNASTPVVYVSEASNIEEADAIHKKVWNQNIVPFLIVCLPTCVRLYSGFQYQRLENSTVTSQQRGVLEAAVSFNNVLSALSNFQAKNIDNGTLWRERGHQVLASGRVESRLLNNLEELGNWLYLEVEDRELCHALIGKFVYLKFLRDRGILSDWRLGEWNLKPSDVFSRKITLKKFRTLVEGLEDWLNGSIFPLPLQGAHAPKTKILQKVAGIFLGDDFSGQLYLSFAAYDFSHIPIEMLSMIYEQFLSLENRNASEGAFYTPIPLINFMIAELNEQQTLKRGMKILDPSCGSGAFLVQCYRYLIESHIRKSGQRPKLTELRSLLTRHIFGVDKDKGACRVAQLSLVLTMFDYITPPDLKHTNFKLPNLLDTNVFECDFFEPDSTWENQHHEGSFDWIIGNPPWKKLTFKDSHSKNWMKNNAKTCPITNNQLAEAFAWKVLDFIKPDGIVGILLPANILFEHQSNFRRAFFERCNVPIVANFSNLRKVLFGKRASHASMAIFYKKNKEPEPSHSTISIFSPLIVNQVANRQNRKGTLQEIWNIIINASEINEIDYKHIAGGSLIPWKVAMWGSIRDLRLIQQLSDKFPKLKEFAGVHELISHEGLQLRSANSNMHLDMVDPLPDVVGKPALSMKVLWNMRRIYSLPEQVLANKISSQQAYVRKGRGSKSLSVCKPPHIIVSAARKFAIYSEEFVVIPGRQIGIAGAEKSANLLKALSLYLNSNLMIYYEFFASPQGGVREGRSTLRTLRNLPVALKDSENSIAPYLRLHTELVDVSNQYLRSQDNPTLLEELELSLSKLEAELNELVYDSFRLGNKQRVLINDFINVRKHLDDGRVGKEAVRAPTFTEFELYAKMLKSDLDSFVQFYGEARHEVKVVFGAGFGMVQVSLHSKGNDLNNIQILPAEQDVSKVFSMIQQRLTSEHGQWLYFDRNLFIYRDDSSFIIKPLELFSWTQSQALQDAAELINSAFSESKL